MTRTAFINAMRAECAARYAWAQTNPAKLEDFMTAIVDTIEGQRTAWRPASKGAAGAAWQAIGGDPRKLTLDAIRRLPR